MSSYKVFSGLSLLTCSQSKIDFRNVLSIFDMVLLFPFCFLDDDDNNNKSNQSSILFAW